MKAIPVIPDLAGRGQDLVNMLGYQDQKICGEWAVRNASEFSPIEQYKYFWIERRVLNEARGCNIAKNRA